jgi:uncharacterized protein with ParB-like and HNH nuclease domain
MLSKEIETAQRSVKTDSYMMSLGEVVSMYKEGEITISPAFQRLFRWEIGQKSKLIESILLGIPIPSIFVFEKPNSEWELIDGLQRISTILEFMGILKDPDNEEVQPPSALTETEYLPSLKNAVWEKNSRIREIPESKQVELDNSQKLAIRRSRLSVEILKQTSDKNTKYDLFQRLNAGGTQANSQELRNCIVIMVNEKYHSSMRSLAEFPAFLRVMDIKSDQIEKQRDMEFVSRFLVHANTIYNGRLDIEEYIDAGVIKLAKAG